MGATVLVADDEPKIVALVRSYLEASGFRVIDAGNGADALAAAVGKRPDCVILDINMPGMDGIEAARELRKVSDVPVIFLSARADETDRVVGLEIGADDYVTKPFSPRELVARVKAILRRARPGPTAETPILARGGLEIDTERRTATVDGRRADLTTAQFDLLVLLARHPGRVWSRLEILEALFEDTHEGYERTVDAHVKNVRKALGDDPDEPRFLETVRGAGYRFRDDAP